jgi:CII-binding regulator of phage lambda lysogenization HflD
MKLSHIVLFAVAALLALPAAAQSASDMQILAEKIKADKKLLVAANMELTEAEAKAFWPVYEAYQKELQGINKRLLGTIKNYSDVANKGQVSDEAAKKLINEAIAIEDAEVKLKRSYVPKLEKVLPGIKVARYLQIENKIRAVVRHELAAEIPLVQ